jgi:hypothetical protein
MADFFKMASFFKIKIDLFSKGSFPTLFKGKNQVCSAKAQDLPEKITKEKFLRWRIFLNWHLYFFLI